MQAHVAVLAERHIAQSLMLLLNAAIITHVKSRPCAAGVPQAIVTLISQVCSSIADVQHDRGACCDLAAFVCSAVGLLCKERALRTGQVDLGMLRTELQAALNYVDGFSSARWRHTLAKVTHYFGSSKGHGRHSAAHPRRSRPQQPQIGACRLGPACDATQHLHRAA